MRIDHRAIVLLVSILTPFLLVAIPLLLRQNRIERETKEKARRGFDVIP